MHVNAYVQNAVIRRVRHIMCFACRSCFSFHASLRPQLSNQHTTALLVCSRIPVDIPP